MNVWVQRCQTCWTVCVLWLSTATLTTRAATLRGSLAHLSSGTGDGFLDGPSSMSIEKRQSADADSWSICPSSMERVDCFYEYLRVYARLRKAASSADSVSVRNIGKRSGYDSSSSSSPLFPSSSLSSSSSSYDDDRDLVAGDMPDDQTMGDDDPCPHGLDPFLCAMQQMSPSGSIPDPCPVGLSSDLCTVLRLDAFMKGLAEILSRERKLR